MLGGGDYCWHPANGDNLGQKEIQWRRWIVGIEGANTSQRCLVAAILEERGGGRKEIWEVLAPNFWEATHWASNTKTEMGAAAKGQSAERALAAASSS